MESIKEFLENKSISNEQDLREYIIVASKCKDKDNITSQNMISFLIRIVTYKNFISEFLNDKKFFIENMKIFTKTITDGNVLFLFSHFFSIVENYVDDEIESIKNIDIITALTMLGFDLNCTNYSNESLLHYFINKEYYRSVKFLLERGFNQLNFTQNYLPFLELGKCRDLRITEIVFDNLVNKLFNYKKIQNFLDLKSNEYHVTPYDTTIYDLTMFEKLIVNVGVNGLSFELYKKIRNYLPHVRPEVVHEVILSSNNWSYIFEFKNLINFNDIKLNVHHIHEYNLDPEIFVFILTNLTEDNLNKVYFDFVVNYICHGKNEKLIEAMVNHYGYVHLDKEMYFTHVYRSFVNFNITGRKINIKLFLSNEFIEELLKNYNETILSNSKRIYGANLEYYGLFE